LGREQFDEDCTLVAVCCEGRSAGCAENDRHARRGDKKVREQTMRSTTHTGGSEVECCVHDGVRSEISDDL
jgi:hypothetical protein